MEGPAGWLCWEGLGLGVQQPTFNSQLPTSNIQLPTSSHPTIHSTIRPSIRAAVRGEWDVEGETFDTRLLIPDD